jgi:hypothetical protein
MDVRSHLFLSFPGVLISTVQATLLANQPEQAMRLDRLAGLGLPALFFALIALCMI